MIKEIRTSKASKIVAYYLSLMIILEIVAPFKAYALTEGPSQPEFNSFTPIGTSDMVDLTSGDLNYNIPIMDVGGYPINLSYQAGITMDQEASWVGLGWNLNVGQINRQVRGLPDDFKGDEIVSVNNIRKNITIGVQGYVNVQVIGALDTPPPPQGAPALEVGGGLNIQYNNYVGLSAVPSYGISFKINDNVSVGMDMSSSTENGVSITPNASVKLSGIVKNSGTSANSFLPSLSPSITYNSRQGLESFSLGGGIGIGKDDAKFKSSTGANHTLSFLTKTFTPTKRLAFRNNSTTFSFSTGPACFGVHDELSLTAYATVQSLKDKIKLDKAYGYDFTEMAGENDLLDFNREKEAASVTKNTLVLPVTNQTYDLYSVNSQGLSGQFRPYRGQVGFVRDPQVNDVSDSNSFGAELEGGCGVHAGLNYKHTDANVYTGSWDANAVNYFKYKTSGNKLEYRPVYFKMTGETRADTEWADMFSNKLSGKAPITLALDINKNATNVYMKKEVSSGGYSSGLTATPAFNGPIKRELREKNNTVVQKISKSEATSSSLSPFVKVNASAQHHHTAGYIITDENGSRHIYGETAYNKEKHEVSFAVGGNFVDKPRGLVNYTTSNSSLNNSAGVDHYFNRQSTPAYAHTYLLTSLLSPDYEDVTGDGPSDDDMGSYTKFEYVNKGDYKWRAPYTQGMASYNEGLKTLKGGGSDDKGSYLYGIKENKYVSRIVTKTHVAFFDLDKRYDGYGVIDERGGGSEDDQNSRMYCIKSIRLYSKPEVTDGSGIIHDPLSYSPFQNIKPIKTAHFDYDYSLCPGVENTFNVTGKLTLKKLYFTYRGSSMGRFTQYRFNYDGNINPSYQMKEFDVWGNYKQSLSNSDFSDNNKRTSNQEFPYVNQMTSEINPIYDSKKHQQDRFAAAWSLSSIELPSGGIINFTYESDDYKYVQNKRAVQMFKVAGVSAQPTLTSMSQLNNRLHSGPAQAKYVVIKLDEDDTVTDEFNFKQRYIGEQTGKPIFFNFLLNMTGSDYEYIEGYFKIDEATGPKFVESGADKYIFIPMDYVNQEGKLNGTKNSNPISVAGWFFGRKNLNREVNQVYQGIGWGDALNVVEVGKQILDNIGSAFEVFNGGNNRLEGLGCADNFKKDKSWIRLQEPTGRKLGGGLRVKKVVMNDGWNNMLATAPDPLDINRYRKEYGQEYNYTLPDYTATPDDNASSGVATYEPSGSKENPFIVPFYHGAEKLTARAYEEEPFGESFFPAATVTYSYVTVKNITAADNDVDPEIPESKTRTGKVVTQHYTSYDFPTKTDFTTLDNESVKRFSSNEEDVAGNLLKGMLGLKIEVKTELTMTQGFTIETNDMNGKLKKQEVFDNANTLISSVEYKYNTETDKSTLKNIVPVVNEIGEIDEKEIGVEYDIINDFRQSYAFTKTFGVGGNVDFIPLGWPIVVGFGVPERAEHTQALKMATTTKVIQRKGLLAETIAFDLGSRVTTKNLAWDPNTGQVLATETINEFDDEYYTLNYPAYWKYNYMGHATENIDLSGYLLVGNMLSDGSSECSIENPATGGVMPQISKYLKKGDELLIKDRIYWVDNYIGTPSTSTKVKLIERNTGTWQNMWKYANSTTLSGNKVKFKVVRSGYRNQQMASMAGITCLVNPIKNSNGSLRNDINGTTFEYAGSGTNYRIINASAVTYNEVWNSQCECDLPVIHLLQEPNGQAPRYNPYVYNMLGEWHPDSSWAYLTVRESSPNYITRNSGFFSDFGVFYKYTGTWQDVHNSKWTTASTVTNYSPKGMELENRDALGRYSSAQYGHNYTLPVAVASNSRYSDMGYQGFEEDEDPDWNYIQHFGFPSDQGQFFPNCTDPNTITLVPTESHTGKRSLLVPPGESKTVCYYHNTIDRDKYGCTSFTPTAGSYLISAWVKEGTSTQQKTYIKSQIGVGVNSDGVLNTYTTLQPTGKIVDGWQKIEGVVNFNYDPGQYPGLRFNISLRNLYSSGTPVYFDDIRIHPVDATMKSFAYDRATQRLMAELDENNYATFYEYDLEGGLVRVKKETENGIYTIQETRSGNRKTSF